MSRPAIPHRTHIRDLLSKAIEAQNRGQLSLSEKLVREVLRYFPDHPDALNLLGGLFAARRDMKRAKSHFARASRAAPQIPLYHYNLGCALVELGEYRAAIAALESVAQLAPGMPEPYLNLANAWRRMGAHEKALSCYEKAISLRPTYRAALNGLASLQVEHGDHEAAIAVLERGSTGEGVDVLGWNTLGLAYSGVGRVRDAEAAFRNALQLWDEFVDARLNLANLLCDQGRSYDAARVLPANLPGNAPVALTHCRVAKAMLRDGDLGGAEERFRRALKLVPGLGKGLVGLGDVFAASGQFLKAEEYFRDALSKNPDESSAYLGLAAVRRYHCDDPDIGAANSSLASRELGDEDRINLHFALGKMLDGCGSHEEAFTHWKAANGLKWTRLSPRYDRDQHRRFVDTLIKVFSSELFASKQGLGSSSERPLFIVGMPRSGTTLVEQILAGHPEVAAGGEMRFFSATVSAWRETSDGGETYPELALSLSKDRVATIVQGYLDELARISPTARRVSDKMPENFLHLGLIALLFPNARVIHCRRNPLDVCVSIYSQSFNSYHNYACDLADIADYFRQYARLMEHWHAVLRLPVLDVYYEDLVANQADVSKRMLEYAGLDWAEACMDFHASDRPVGTASLWQVRQPIYRSSVERWRRYESQIGPLIKELEQAVAAYPEPADLSPLGNA